MLSHLIPRSKQYDRALLSTDGFRTVSVEHYTNGGGSGATNWIPNYHLPIYTTAKDAGEFNVSCTSVRAYQRGTAIYAPKDTTVPNKAYTRRLP
jgi:hypothetical protein